MLLDLASSVGRRLAPPVSRSPHRTQAAERVLSLALVRLGLRDGRAERVVARRHRLEVTLARLARRMTRDDQERDGRGEDTERITPR